MKYTGAFKIIFRRTMNNPVPIGEPGGEKKKQSLKNLLKELFKEMFLKL